MLAAASLSLAAMWLHRQGGTTLDDADGLNAERHRQDVEGHAHETHTLMTMPASFHPGADIPFDWRHEHGAKTLPCKLAVRLIESRDAFIVSLPARNLTTNGVRVSLSGSLLTVHTQQALTNAAATVVRNCILLPAAVDSARPPSLFLTNDQIQVRICKLTHAP